MTLANSSGPTGSPVCLPGSPYAILPVAELAVGMYITKYDTPQAKGKVYNVEGLITYKVELNEILAQGFDCAVIDTSRGAGAVCGSTKSALETAITGTVVRPKGALPMQAELKAAQSVHRDAQTHLRDLFSRMRQNASPDFSASQSLVARLADSMRRNHDALPSLCQLKPAQEPGVALCLNVTATTLYYGHYLGLETKLLTAVGMVGLLTNAGRQGQEDRLPEGLEGSSTEGLTTLGDLGGEDSRSATIGDSGLVLARLQRIHARHGLSVFFSQFAGQELEMVSQIVALAEAYATLTAKKGNRNGLTTHQAVGKLFAARGNLYPNHVVDHFIRCVGIYPVGSLVRLSNGHHGLVCSSPVENAMTPKVKVCLDEKLRPTQPKELDMATIPDIKIVKCLDARKAGLDIARLLLG